MEKEIGNLLYKNIDTDQVSAVVDQKESTLDFNIYDEIKKLENAIEDLKEKKKSYAKLMFAIPASSLAVGFTLSVGVAFFSTLENLTMQNFIENFLLPENLYSFYAVPTLLGLYYSWVVLSEDYHENKRLLNVDSLKLYFLKHKILSSKEELRKLYVKLSKYGEEMEKYLKKYKKGKWGLQDAEMLEKDNIDSYTFEKYLETHARKRWI